MQQFHSLTTQLKRVAIYCRLSQDRSGQGAAVERQREACETKALANGWDVVAVLTDNDTSAFSGKKRPAYASLLQLIESGQVDAVIAFHEDRLHRSPLELEHYIDLCQPRDIETDFVISGRLDLRSASGRMTARIRGAVAREEVEHKSERERAKRDSIARAGKRHQAGRVYGWDDGGMTIRESEAAIVREMVRRVIDGEKCTAIARDLNTRSVPAMKGGRWYGRTVKAIVSRASNAAIRSHHGAEYPGNWQAIISVDDYRLALAILNNPSTKYKRTAGRKHELSGLAYCVCGNKLSVRMSASNAKPAYRCDTSRSHEPDRSGCGKVSRHTVPLEHLVREAVIYRLDGDGLLQVLNERQDTSDTVRRLVAEAEMQRAKIEQLTLEYATTSLWTPGEFKKAKTAADVRLREIDAHIASQSVTRHISRLELGTNLREWFDGASVDERHALYSLLIERVVVHPVPMKRGYKLGYDRTGPVEERINAELVSISWRA